MKIAVTYENGQVFQHFGHSEAFKVYEIENEQVVSSEVIAAEGAGHDAIAGFLADRGIDAVLCGGIGGGAMEALNAAGIEVISGVEGEADAAVEAFLDGELTSAGQNCDHHHDEEEGCGSGCGGCGGGCGGCGGGCGGGAPAFEGKNVGKRIKAHYKGTFNDGTQFDSSYDRGEPLEFICGAGMMILGFDKACADLDAGECVDIHLMPEDAYGPKDPNAIFTVELSEMPGAENLAVGQKVFLVNSMGRRFPVEVIEKTETTITFDANHEMAGKELNFHIEIVEIGEIEF